MSQQQITPNYDFDFDFGFAEAAEASETQYPMAPTNEYAQQHGTFGVFPVNETGVGDFSELFFDGQQLAENSSDLETWLQSPSTESFDSMIAQVNEFQEGFGQFNASVGLNDAQVQFRDGNQQEGLGQFVGVVPNNPHVAPREGNQQENVVDGHAVQAQSIENWPQQTLPYQGFNMPPPPVQYRVPAFCSFVDPQLVASEEYIPAHFEQGANDDYRPLHPEQEETQPSITPPQQASQTDTQLAHPYGLAFGNLAQAEAAMAQRRIEKNWHSPENDESIPTIDNERAAYVYDLLEAMKDTSKCQDRSAAPSFQNRWGANATYEPLPEQMEKVCWKVVEVAEKLHIQGPASLSIYDPQAMALVFKSRLLTFKQRIEHTCELMRLSKARCFHMLKGESIETTVGSPVQRINGTKVNHDQNGKRQQIMEEGRPLWKKKNGAVAASQSPAEENEEEGFNGSGGPNDVGVVPAADAVGHDPHANMQYGDPLHGPHQPPNNFQASQTVGSSNWASGTNYTQLGNGNTGYARRSSSKKRTADDAHIDAEVAPAARRIR